MARAHNWRALSDADLLSSLDEAREDLFRMRFQVVTGRLDNTARLKEARRHVARGLTELRRREIEAAEMVEMAEVGQTVEAVEEAAEMQETEDA